MIFKRIVVFTLGILTFALAVNGDELSKMKVEKITDPTQYSAGKMSAAEINKLIDRSFKPENYDIWYGKKQRINLNGSWKFIKLSDTADSPGNEYGEKHGFNSENFSDSSWFNQPVPWMWNIKFPSGRYLKPEIVNGKKEYFAGIGWYRRKINIPAKLKGSQVIICFPRIDRESTVYINGRKAGGHRNFGIVRGVSTVYYRPEGFEINITPYVKFGKLNTIAIKVYEDGKYNSVEQPERRFLRPGWGGIWQEVFLEIRPSVYCSKALVTPELKTDSIKIKAFIENTTKNYITESLCITLAPWKSNRYHMAKGNTEIYHAGKFTFKPGMNTIEFTVKLKKPQLWDIDNPYLYHLTVSNDKGVVLGQERFGFREFTVGEKLFALNGKNIFLMSETEGRFLCLGFGNGTLGLQRLAFLRKGDLKHYIDTMKAENYNMLRNNSNFPLKKLIEQCDESGMLLYEEEPYAWFLKSCYDIKTASFTDAFKEKIRNAIYGRYNSPSVVIRSGGNEFFDSRVIHMKDFPSYAPYANAMVKEYKKHDTTRPITSSSGRFPTDTSLRKLEANGFMTIEYVPCDFNDAHIYGASFQPPMERHNYRNYWQAPEKIYKAYVLDSGKKVALLNGEACGTALWPPDHGFARMQMRLLVPHFKNGKFDKKWFIHTLPKRFCAANSGGFLGGRPFHCFFAELITFDSREKANMLYFKSYVEWQRTMRNWMAGYEINEIARAVRSRKALKHNKYDFVKIANQPLNTIIDSKLNRNVVTGKKYSAEIFVVNDYRRKVGPVTVKLFLKSLDGKNIYNLGAVTTKALPPAGMEKKILAYKVPDAIPTGHYQFRVDFSSKDGYKGKNFFARDAYVLNSGDIKLKLPANFPAIGIYAPSENTQVKTLVDILVKLKVPFKKIMKLEKVSGLGILIVPPMAVKKDAILPADFKKWLTGGGKLICFEQQNLFPVLSGQIIPAGEHGFSSELLEPEHPLFDGLVRNDFILWNSWDKKNFDSRNLFHYAVVPPDMSAIAIDLISPTRFGSAVMEYKFGKGLALFSQFSTIRRFGDDSVATKYLLNLLQYTLGNWNGKYAFAAKLPEKTQHRPHFVPNLKKLFFINLKPYANMGFKDDVARDRKGGWTDNGPDKDMRNLPVGRQTFKGIPFDIINPAKNHGKSCVVLRGSRVSRTDFLPSEVKNIRLDRKVKKLYFLVAVDWAPLKGKLGDISVAYSNVGMGMFFNLDIPLIAGKNVDNWKMEFSTPPPRFSVPGWVGETGRTPAFKKAARTYIIEWENPDPQRPLLFFNFKSNGKAALILLAVTGEDV